METSRSVATGDGAELGYEPGDSPSISHLHKPQLLNLHLSTESCGFVAISVTAPESLVFGAYSQTNGSGGLFQGLLIQRHSHHALCEEEGRLGAPVDQRPHVDLW